MLFPHNIPIPNLPIMLFSKALLIGATTAITTAGAYSSNPLEVRSDLDFTPEDLDILFGRDLYDGSLEHIDVISRDLDSNAENLHLLLARQALEYETKSNMIQLSIRDLNLNAVDQDILWTRDPGVRNTLRDGRESFKSGVKKTVGACLGCMTSTGDTMERGVISANRNVEKGTIMAKHAAVGTGKFIKKGFTGPQSEYLGQISRMDPIALMVGGFPRPTISDGREPYQENQN